MQLSNTRVGQAVLPANQRQRRQRRGMKRWRECPSLHGCAGRTLLLRTVAGHEDDALVRSIKIKRAQRLPREGECRMDPP
jgi:hypothetical protein